MTSAWGGVEPEIELNMPAAKTTAYARIQIASHNDGRWMWAIDYLAGNHGSGYWVAPKWGNFAECAETAKSNAISEIRERIQDGGNSASRLILAWLESLSDSAPRQADMFA